MSQTLFLIISALGLLAALGTVLHRNLVHAALHLVAFFFIVACQFVLLEAEFLAAIQVLVYIGAVAILLMFGDHADPQHPGGRHDDRDAASGACRRWWRAWPCSSCSASGSTGSFGPGSTPPWRATQIRPAIKDDKGEADPAPGRRRSTTWARRSATR